MKHAIPTDWDGESFCRYAICWPDSPIWRALLRGLVTEPARGFFWDERTGYIKGVLSQFRVTLDENLQLPEVLMACNDTGLSEGLQAIAQAIITASANASASASANACCEQQIINQNGGISGSVTQPGTGETIPIFGTQPPKSVPPGEYPEGYDSRAEYDLDKCQVANLAIDGFIQSLRNLATLGAFNYGALLGLIIVSLVGLIVFPPAALPIMAAALGFLAVNITLLAVFANHVEENRQEWVCVLYESDSVEAALSVIADLVDGIIATIGTSGAVGFAIKQIALLLLNGDTLNQLFTKTAHLTYPDADCSNCDGCLDTPLEDWTPDSAVGSSVSVVDDWLRGTGVYYNPFATTYAYVQFDFDNPVNINSLSFTGRGSASEEWQMGWITYQDISSYPNGESASGGGAISDEEPFSQAVGDTEVIRLILIARVNPLADPGTFSYFEWSDICILGHSS